MICKVGSLLMALPVIAVVTGEMILLPSDEWNTDFWKYSQSDAFGQAEISSGVLPFDPPLPFVTKSKVLTRKSFNGPSRGPAYVSDEHNPTANDRSSKHSASMAPALPACTLISAERYARICPSEIRGWQAPFVVKWTEEESLGDADIEYFASVQDRLSWAQFLSQQYLMTDDHTGNVGGNGNRDSIEDSVNIIQDSSRTRAPSTETSIRGIEYLGDTRPPTTEMSTSGTESLGDTRTPTTEMSTSGTESLGDTRTPTTEMSTSGAESLGNTITPSTGISESGNQSPGHISTQPAHTTENTNNHQSGGQTRPPQSTQGGGQTRPPQTTQGGSQTHLPQDTADGGQTVRPQTTQGGFFVTPQPQTSDDGAQTFMPPTTHGGDQILHPQHTSYGGPETQAPQPSIDGARPQDNNQTPLPTAAGKFFYERDQTRSVGATVSLYDTNSVASSDAANDFYGNVEATPYFIGKIVIPTNCYC